MNNIGQQFNVILAYNDYSQLKSIAKQSQCDNSFSSRSGSVSHSEKQPLFSLCYLLSLQLRKYMEQMRSIVRMRIEDLQDPSIFQQKQEQIDESMKKFKKHFSKNFSQLVHHEGDEFPKYSNCFSELVNFLDIEVCPKADYPIDFGDEDHSLIQKTFDERSKFKRAPNVIQKTFDDRPRN